MHINITQFNIYRKMEPSRKAMYFKNVSKKIPIWILCGFLHRVLSERPFKFTREQFKSRITFKCHCIVAQNVLTSALLITVVITLRILWYLVVFFSRSGWNTFGLVMHTTYNCNTIYFTRPDNYHQLYCIKSITVKIIWCIKHLRVHMYLVFCHAVWIGKDHKP